MQRYFLLALALAIAGWAALLPRPAHADGVYTVNTVLDEREDDYYYGFNICMTDAGTCSLRAAIMEANLWGGTVTITLPAGIYKIRYGHPPPGACCNDDTLGDFNLSAAYKGAVTISGAGPALTVIDGDLVDRIFHVEAGANVELRNLTLRNGNPTDRMYAGFFASGGGVLNEGTLTLDNVVVSANVADTGGGIYNTGLLSVLRSTIEANSASSYGGIANVGGTLVVDQSTIDANSASGAGGIYNDGTASTIVTNSTISGNFSSNGAGGIANAGMINMYNSSIVGNQTGAVGGGVVSSGSAIFNLRNSLVVGNFYVIYTSLKIYSDCYGTVASYGANLFSIYDPSCNHNGPGSTGILNSLQSIGALQDNGGPTFTHALLPGSNAIDAVASGGCIGPSGTTLFTDQRGRQRLSGAHCDVGSFEYNDVIFKNGFDTPL